MRIFESISPLSIHPLTHSHTGLRVWPGCSSTCLLTGRPAMGAFLLLFLYLLVYGPAVAAAQGLLPCELLGIA